MTHPTPIRLVLPWECLASSNTRNARRGGRAHSWGYKRARDTIHLASLAQLSGAKPRVQGDTPVRVTLYFHPPDARRRDVSNYCKALFDGMEGAAYADDYQIQSHTVTRMPPDRANPRVEVTIQEVEG